MDYWQSKIERNRKRDIEERHKLQSMGWHCITVWECQLKPKTREATLAELEHLLHRTYLDNLRPRKATMYSFNTDPAPRAAEEQVEYERTAYGCNKNEGEIVRQCLTN